ncbi:MAG: prepilin-type N-terminal cleavage/methylation domain-containing protein [Desulfobacterales bacterium]|nr:prepilin-type N-terminal cleavage/methylation domain-containing protein [Desulfobacterales bacterium]
MRSPLKTKSRLSDARGFTLVEAMIGLLVFAVGVLGMLKFQAVSINSNNAAHISSENTNAGVSAIERLFALDWDEPGARPEDDGNDTIGESRVTFDITTGPSAGTMALVDERGRPSVRLITVTSTFVDQGGTERTTTLRLIKPRM